MCYCFECVEFDVIVYVVLVCVGEWLLVLCLDVVLCCCCVMEMLVLLVCVYLFVQFGQVLVLCGVCVECGEYVGGFWLVGQVCQFVWVVGQVVELIGIGWVMYVFLVVVVDYYDWCECVFCEVFVECDIVCGCVVQMWYEVCVVDWVWLVVGGCGVGQFDECWQQVDV